jgi:gluconate 2-dehydrogenase gamma chain
MTRKRKNPGLTRRDFVRTVAAGAGASAIAAGCARKPPSRWRVLTDEQAELVVAICEQIVPRDQDPGATDAGVVHFIDRQLAGFYAKHRSTYENGLRGVEETSREMFDKGFLGLKWDQQTAVLRALESGKAKGAVWEKESAQTFFRMIRDHTLQGFYGSPRHGGNRNYASYRMLGLEYPALIGQNRYEDSEEG